MENDPQNKRTKPRFKPPTPTYDTREVSYRISPFKIFLKGAKRPVKRQDGSAFKIARGGDENLTPIVRLSPAPGGVSPSIGQAEVRRAIQEGIQKAVCAQCMACSGLVFTDPRTREALGLDPKKIARGENYMHGSGGVSPSEIRSMYQTRFGSSSGSPPDQAQSVLPCCQDNIPPLRFPVAIRRSGQKEYQPRAKK